MQILSEKFPNLQFAESSVSLDDRQIPMMRVGLGMETLICTAGVHGRESINPVLLLRMMEEY